MIKNIIFDIGGVLVDFHPVKTLQDMGLSFEEAEELYRIFVPDWYKLDEGIVPHEDIFNEMIKRTPEKYKKTADTFFHEYLFSTVTSFDYSREWVKSLHDKGFNIYLLTNYSDDMFDFHWKNVFTFADFVDGEVVSAKVKLIKPDERIYRTILEKYGLDAGESVFIDDRLENVEAACRLGIHGIRFTELEEVKKELDSLLNGIHIAEK